MMNLGYLTGWIAPHLAQNDRISTAAWRKVGQPGRPVQRTLRPEQDVLQDSQEGACLPGF